MRTTRYDSSPVLRNPNRFFREMVCDLIASRELAWRLFLRDLKAKYRASILGYIWVLLPPLAITTTFFLLQKAKVMNISQMAIPYPLFVLTGTTFWQLFTDAVQSPLKLVNQSKTMLTKINFPREALIGAAALESLFTFSIRFIILLICLPFFGIYFPIENLIYLPFAIVGLLVAGLSLGVLLAPLGVLFQDFSQGLPLFLSVWMIATPITYPIGQISGLLEKINHYNPLTVFIDWPRSLILPLESTTQTAWLLTTVSTLILAFIAWILFRIALPHIIARIGS